MGYSIFPNDSSTATTVKKRTSIQAQTHKSNVIVVACKDLIITTENNTDSRVSTINGNEVDKKMFLPNDDHPFDHFVVQSVVKEKSEEQ